LKDLKQISVIGLGLLGGSISLAISRLLPKVKVAGYTHRASTRRSARKLSIANEIVNDIKKSVSKADLVIIATPIFTFEQIFMDIADALPVGCIVTDVGSTKVLSHHWAAKRLPKRMDRNKVGFFLDRSRRLGTFSKLHSYYTIIPAPRVLTDHREVDNQAFPYLFVGTPQIIPVLPS